MSKYEIVNQKIYTGETKKVILCTETGLYFSGYDFMGSVDWVRDVLAAYYMHQDEAEQIVADLEAADGPVRYSKKDRITTVPFIWGKGCLNDNGTKILKSEGIEFCYRMQKLCTRSSGKWFPVEYRRVRYLPDGLPLWEITYHY